MGIKIDKRVEDKWGGIHGGWRGRWVMDERMAKKRDGRLDGWCWVVFGKHRRVDRCVDG